jgi:hypothetical protein
MRQSQTLPLTSVSLYSGSLQVAVSPCWERDFPDVISANLCPRAWTPTPAALVVHLPVSSHKTTAFPTLGPGQRLATPVQQLQYGLYFGAAVIHSCSGPRVCSPPRLLLPLCTMVFTRSTGQPWLLRPSSTRVVTFPCFGYACRPYRAIDGRGLSPHKIRSLVGCSPNG